MSEALDDSGLKGFSSLALAARRMNTDVLLLFGIFIIFFIVLAFLVFGGFERRNEFYHNSKRKQ